MYCVQLEGKQVYETFFRKIRLLSDSAETNLKICKISHLGDSLPKLVSR